jgi:hypothetical protein
MYKDFKNKTNKYKNKLNQLGGLKCPFNQNDIVQIKNPASPYNNYLGKVVKIEYNVPSGAYYFNPICNKIIIDVDKELIFLSTELEKIFDQKLGNTLYKTQWISLYQIYGVLNKL